MTLSKPLSIDDIQSRMRSSGSHWWDADSMRMWGTRVIGDAWTTADGASVYFATSDKQYNGSRAYTVRRYDVAANEIHTVGQLGDFKSGPAAKTCARTLAGNQAANNSEPLTPVTPADDLQRAFAADGLEIDEQRISRLIYLAGRHHQECENECNGVDSRLEDIEERLTHWAQDNMRGRALIIGGDPRGCTVKIKFRNGATNDFGGEGWCVPQN